MAVETPKWILIAEDDEHDRFFIARAFEQADIPVEVVFAHDGLEVFTCLHRQGRFEKRPKGLPSAVILDHSMPHLSGLQVLERLRKTSAFSLLPIVLHSAQMNPREIEQAYRLGANAYVEKPVGLQPITTIFKELGIFWGIINVVAHGGADGSEQFK